MFSGETELSSTPQLRDDLLVKLRRRDPSVLTATVNEHTRPLYRAARGLGFQESEAEDLVQEVFATFLETLDRFEGKSQVRTWLFGILHRKVLERRREMYREGETDSIEDVFESRFRPDGTWARPPQDLDRILQSREIGKAIQGCMEQLPGLQREVFVLREIEDLETAEICKILDITATNMSVLLHRARNRLRECIEARGWNPRR